MKRVSGVVAMAVIVCLGCYHAPGGIAPSTIPVEPNGYTVINPNAVGTDCVWRLFEVIPISGGNHLHDAVREAIQDSNADALIGVTVETTSSHLIIIGKDCTQVRGQAVRIGAARSGSAK